ncbi:hypothetical protein [Agarilytica rhodophyticola]|uniref:hypothetical protein n=1 Tax=Agarilytica rhodophyticola TaxID=1737490 RepID=UPI000B34341B|nr:hypothetical protein [Agarilytica rhodophyticola]
MNPLRDVRQSVERNVDTKIAVSTAVGVAGMGLVAYLFHKSNVKALKKVADIATAKKTGGK